MSQVSDLDWAIIAAFFAISIIAGLLLTRKANKNLESYFLGGRSLPWYLLGLSGMAAWFDLTGTMFITSFLFLLGPRGLFIAFGGGAVLVLAFMAVFTGKWHRRSGVMTSAEWVTYRFGGGAAARWMRLIFAVKWLIVTVATLAYLVRGTSLFVGQFVPFSPIAVTLAIIAISSLYTILSGFYGVVLTDAIQGIIILVSSLIIATMAFNAVPDSTTLASLAEEVTGNPHWTESTPRWHTPMPPGYEVYGSLILFAGFYLLRSILVGLGTGAESRFFGARNDRECGLQSILQGLTIGFRWPMMIGFAVLGILLVHDYFPESEAISRAATAIQSHHPELTPAEWHSTTAAIMASPDRADPSLIKELATTLGPDWQTKLGLIGINGTVNPEQILPTVIANTLPSGLRGFILIAMIAAMMSTLTTGLNQAAAVAVKDIYQNLFRPLASQRELISVSYCVSILLVASGFWMGINASSINDLWGWVMIGLTSGWIAPLALRLYWWRCNAWGIIYGTSIGGAAAIVQRLFFPATVEWMQFIIISAFSFAGTIIGSLYTKPTPQDVLENFYRTTRPFGLWAPLKNSLPTEQRAHLAEEHRQDLLAIPFFLVAQITLFLLPMQIVIHSYSAFWYTLPLFIIGAAGVYKYLWRRLLP